MVIGVVVIALAVIIFILTIKKHIRIRTGILAAILIIGAFTIAANMSIAKLGDSPETSYESDEDAAENVGKTVWGQQKRERRNVLKKNSDRRKAERETESVPDQQYITLVAIGDMLMHPGVSGYAFKADGSIDYSFIFDPIRDQVLNADIAAVNNEVPFGGNEYGLMNYPQFNVLTNLGDAEVAAGFDVILNASNHVMDMNTNGVLNTLNFWKKYPEVRILGIHESAEDQRAYKVIERAGKRIALFNYTYGLNAFGLPADRPYFIDLLTNDYREKIREELTRAEQEADFTIVFPHWGEEYQLHENQKQQEWAAFFTECGADLIIGTHPHCLEPVKTVTASNGNTSLCYYSLGNYISQQDETISILGGLAKVTLEADENGVRIVDHGMDYLVTQYDETVTFSYVVRLENYTPYLAACHGINTLGAPGNGSGSTPLNAYYPMNVDTLYRIIDEINGGPAAALPAPVEIRPRSVTPAAVPETTAPVASESETDIVETPAETLPPETLPPETTAPETLPPETTPQEVPAEENTET